MGLRKRWLPNGTGATGSGADDSVMISGEQTGKSLEEELADDAKIDLCVHHLMALAISHILISDQTRKRDVTKLIYFISVGGWSPLKSNYLNKNQIYIPLYFFQRLVSFQGNPPFL